MVAAGYRPGLVRFGIDDFSLSVSIPVITLANDIPVRALMAWDRRLLSRTQNLTLLISGLRGTYPPLKPDGTYSQDAILRGTNLQFNVGLTRNYKPSKEHALDAKRSFGLVDQPNTGWTPDEPAISVIDSDGCQPEDDVPQEEEEEEEDEGRFDTFSLSNSLESLLNHSLVRVIHMRLKYNLGWAGAETLVAETEKLQRTPDDVLATSRKVLIFRHERFQQVTNQYSPSDDRGGRQRRAQTNE